MNNMNLKKAGLLYTFGSFFNKGIAFFTVPLFTRILSTSDYGIVSTYNSWVGTVTVLISMTLYMAIRQSFIDYPDKVDELHSTITIFITCLSLIIAAGCIFGGVIFRYEIIMPLLCIIQSWASALIENYSMQLMMQFKYILRTVYMVLPNFLSVILAIIFILKTNIYPVYFGRIIPTVVVTFMFGLGVMVAVFRKGLIFNLGLLKYSLAISIPLIAHGLALTVLSQSDRIMITAIVGSNKTAIYSVVYNFSMIATALSVSLGGIWQPWYLAKLKGGTEQDFIKINKMTKVYTVFMTMVLCGIILLAPEVLKFLSPVQYWEGISIIPPIVLANLVTFIYTFYVDIEHFHKKTKYIAKNTVMAAGINVFLNLIFINLCGYEAAAYTTIVSYAISLVAHYIYAKRLESKIASLYSYWPMLAIVIFVSFVYYLAIEYWYIRWSLAVVIAGSTLFYLSKKFKIFK